MLGHDFISHKFLLVCITENLLSKTPLSKALKPFFFYIEKFCRSISTSIIEVISYSNIMRKIVFFVETGHTCLYFCLFCVVKAVTNQE